MKEEELVERGKAIYDTIAPKLIPYYKGQFCVVHIPSKEYFVNPSLIEAIKQASSKYPDKLFYSIKIGEKTIAELKG